MKSDYKRYKEQNEGILFNYHQIEDEQIAMHLGSAVKISLHVRDFIIYDGILMYLIEIAGKKIIRTTHCCYNIPYIIDCTYAFYSFEIALNYDDCKLYKDCAIFISDRVNYQIIIGGEYYGNKKPELNLIIFVSNIFINLDNFYCFDDKMILDDNGQYYEPVNSILVPSRKIDSAIWNKDSAYLIQGINTNISYIGYDENTWETGLMHFVKHTDRLIAHRETIFFCEDSDEIEGDYDEEHDIKYIQDKEITYYFINKNMKLLRLNPKCFMVVTPKKSFIIGKLNSTYFKLTSKNYLDTTGCKYFSANRKTWTYYKDGNWFFETLDNHEILILK